MSCTELRRRILSSRSRSRGRASPSFRRDSLDDDRSLHEGMEQAGIAVSSRTAEDKGPIVVWGDERLTPRIEERMLPSLRHRVGLRGLVAPHDSCSAADGYGLRGKCIRVGAGLVAHVDVGHRGLPRRSRRGMIARYEPKCEDDRRCRSTVKSLHGRPVFSPSCALRIHRTGGRNRRISSQHIRRSVAGPRASSPRAPRTKLRRKDERRGRYDCTTTGRGAVAEAGTTRRPCSPLRTSLRNTPSRTAPIRKIGYSTAWPARDRAW